MSDGKTYKVWTLAEMAEIPEDRLPAFLKELPEIIGAVRAMLDGWALMPEELRAAGNLDLSNTKWTDNSQRNSSVSLSAVREDGSKDELFRVSIKGGPA